MKFLTPTLDSGLVFVISVWQKLETAPWYAKAFGLISAILAPIAGDFVSGALMLAACASMVDWYYGRAVAIRDGKFQRELALYGWQVKAGSLLVVLLVRGIEYWASTVPEPFNLNTHGALAAAVAVGILADELDSIDENLRALGGRGIPILSPLIAWLRGAASRVTVPQHGAGRS